MCLSGFQFYRWPLNGIFKGYAMYPIKTGTPRLNVCIGKGIIYTYIDIYVFIIYIIYIYTLQSCHFKRPASLKSSTHPTFCIPQINFTWPVWEFQVTHTEVQKKNARFDPAQSISCIAGMARRCYLRAGPQK